MADERRGTPERAGSAEPGGRGAWPEGERRTGEPPRSEGERRTGEPSRSGSERRSGEPPRSGSERRSGEPPRPEGERRTGEPPRPEGERGPGEPPQPGSGRRTGEPPQPGSGRRTGEPSRPEGERRTGEPPRSEGERRTGEPPQPGPHRKRAIRALLAYARPHRRMFLLGFLCTFLAIAADLLQPVIVKTAIDDTIPLGSSGIPILIGLGTAYALLAIVGFVFSYWQSNLLQRAGQAIVAQLRKDLFRHITSQSMSFFDRHPIGSLVTNESSDTETINQFFTQVLLSLVRDGLMLVMIIGFMFYLDAELALYALLLIPVIGAIALLFRRALRNAYHRSRAQLSRLIAFTAENLSGMSLIQAFHQEEEQNRRFTESNRTYLRENLREVRATILFNRSFDLLGNAAAAAAVWLGGYAVLNQKFEFGVLYAFITYIRQFFQPINQLTQQWNTMQSTMVSMERLWRIFSEEPEVRNPDPETAVSLRKEDVRGRVDFNRIRFSYVDGQDVLRDLDLHIRPGEFVGIVGVTGAGKSSLVSLLARFYDVDRGSVEIDGVDIRRLPMDTLHRIVGLVQQEPFLFSGTIVDNVRLFREEIGRERVIEACRFVGADEMISRLADGYDTRLSERGSGLSAGERQLISFARIIVFQPKILILDEATANLDSHTERLVQEALDRVARGRTTLVIAHRLSTIRHADRIIVMKGGRIIEEGDHESLLAAGGYYAELHRHSRHPSRAGTAG